MTETQRQFVQGGARSSLVIALLALGGGYAVHQTYISSDEATLIAHMRDRNEDCLQHQIDDLKGIRNGR